MLRHLGLGQDGIFIGFPKDGKVFLGHPKYSLKNVVCLGVPQIIELLLILWPVQELRVIICEEVMIKTYLNPLVSHSRR